MKRWLVALAGLLALAAHAETWRFTVIGDTPYSDFERREFPRMLERMSDEHPELIVHVGDFKASNARCSDELFLDRRALFDASRAPFIYLPGDNEWTDCKRLAAGHFDENERLSRLREIFFATPVSLGQKPLPLERQSSAAPEHLRWRLGPVLFITLNIPGPNNNYGMGQEASAEFLARNPLALDWIKAGFAHAGYRELLERVRRETLAFDGQVLFVHGDTHWQRIDQPLRHPGNGQRIANFTRVETFGYPFMGWTRIIIDDESPELFRFETQAWPPR